MASAASRSRIAVSATRGRAGAAPLASFKAHGGWVGGCGFVGSDKLLTAGNDGLVRRWDCASSQSGALTKVAEAYAHIVEGMVAEVVACGLAAPDWYTRVSAQPGGLAGVLGAGLAAAPGGAAQRPQMALLATVQRGVNGPTAQLTM